MANPQENPIVKIAEQMVRQINFRLVEREGEELKHIRAAEISPENLAAIQATVSKPHEETVFPEGTLTYGDYYGVVRSVYDLLPNGAELMPRYMESPDSFAQYMTRDENANMDSAIASQWNDELTTGSGIKVHVVNNQVKDGRQIAISTESSSPIRKIMGAEVWNKLTNAGLPLIDNRWLFE